jgi:hypothetical protein
VAMQIFCLFVVAVVFQSLAVSIGTFGLLSQWLLEENGVSLHLLFIKVARCFGAYRLRKNQNRDILD